MVSIGRGVPNVRVVSQLLCSDCRLEAIRVAWCAGVDTQSAVDRRSAVRLELNCDRHR